MFLINLLQNFMDFLNILIKLSFSNSDLLILVLLITYIKHNPFLSPPFDIYEIHYVSPPALLSNHFSGIWSFPLFPSRFSIVGFTSFLRVAPKIENTFQVSSSQLLVQYKNSFVWFIHKVRTVVFFLNNNNRNKENQCSFQNISQKHHCWVVSIITDMIWYDFPIVYWIYNASWILKSPVLRLTTQRTSLSFTSSNDSSAQSQ